MTCEMCGNNSTKAVVEIEGVRMTVCERCSSHGSVVHNLNSPVKKKVVRTFVPEKQDMVQRIRPDIAKLLRKHREKIGMDQGKFASKMNIKASAYNHYESGSAVPDIQTANRLERELGIPLVVRIKVDKVSYNSEESKGMTLGDFVKHGNN